MTQAATEKFIRIAALCAWALFTMIAVASFITSASSPTDENVFADPPTPMRVMITAPFSAVAQSPLSRTHDEGATEGPSTVPGGLFVIRANGRAISSPQELTAMARAVHPDSLLVIDAYRPGNVSFLRFKVAPGVFTDSTLTQVENFVIVTQITPDGASDRAGMRVGDLIIRINNKPFKNAVEADNILQRGEGGKALVYEIQRGPDRLTIPVVLAAFGFQVAQLVAHLAGLFAMGAALFLLLRRPVTPGPATVGWTLLSFGFLIASTFGRRDPNQNVFFWLRLICLAWAWVAGWVFSVRSFIHFPSDIAGFVGKRWISFVSAGIALASFVASNFIGNAALLLGAIAQAVLFVYVRLSSRAEISPERKRMARVLRRTGWSLIPLAGLLFGLSALSGFAWSWVIASFGVSLFLITLAVLYTIGRYRLFGLNLRVRRNIRYSFSSILWGSAVVTLFLWAILLLPGVTMRMPAILVHGASIEILDPADHPSGSEWTTRVVLLGVGVIGFVVFSRVRRLGQSWIDRRYYRTHLDYRKAAESLGRLLATTQTLSDLGTGLGESLATLMNVARAGVFFVHGDRVTGCERACGVSREEWHAWCGRVEQLLPEAVQDASDPVRVSTLPEPLRGEFAREGYALLVPVRSSARLLGVLVLGEKQSESAYNDEDFTFLGTAARQTSVAMENAFLYEELAEQERMKHELTIARRIQLASLPQRTPVVPGLDVAGRSIPASEVGGDFFDYLVGPDNKLLVVIGDVSGKGTSAALYMAKVQGILRSLHGFHLSPDQMFLRTNRLLNQDLEKRSFVTALGVEFDPQARTMVMARAGHLPVYHYHAASGRVDAIISRGLGLGLRDEAKFASELELRSVSYAPGDLILLVTDGVTEAMNPGGDEFGDARFGEILHALRNSAAEPVVAEITERVRAFAGDAAQHDDQTLVVIRAV
jgi:phosphoserine phosphatase RsbU/P